MVYFFQLEVKFKGRFTFWSIWNLFCVAVGHRTSFSWNDQYIQPVPAGIEMQRLLCCENTQACYSKEILFSGRTMCTIITESRRCINSWWKIQLIMLELFNAETNSNYQLTFQVTVQLSVLKFRDWWPRDNWKFITLFHWISSLLSSWLLLVFKL